MDLLDGSEVIITETGKGGEEEEELEDDRVEETEIRKEMRRLKSKKAAERWNLKGGLEICRRRIRERSGKSTMDNIFVLYYLM